MAQLYGQLIKDGETTLFRPIQVEETSPGVFALKTTTTIIGSDLSGVPEHHNGNANITAATINFSSNTKHIQIENRSNNTIFVSFDGGSNNRTIDSGITLDIDAISSSIEISADVDTSPYEILALV